MYYVYRLSKVIPMFHPCPVRLTFCRLPSTAKPAESSTSRMGTGCGLAASTAGYKNWRLQVYNRKICDKWGVYSHYCPLISIQWKMAFP